MKEGDNFVIPRGVVHSVSFPEKTHTKFKLRGDQNLIAERDFLMQMLTLIKTVSVHEPRSSGVGGLIIFNFAFRTSSGC